MRSSISAWLSRSQTLLRPLGVRAVQNPRIETGETTAGSPCFAFAPMLASSCWLSRTTRETRACRDASRRGRGPTTSGRGRCRVLGAVVENLVHVFQGDLKVRLVGGPSRVFALRSCPITLTGNPSLEMRVAMACLSFLVAKGGRGSGAGFRRTPMAAEELSRRRNGPRSVRCPSGACSLKLLPWSHRHGAVSWCATNHELKSHVFFEMQGTQLIPDRPVPLRSRLVLSAAALALTTGGGGAHAQTARSYSIRSWWRRRRERDERHLPVAGCRHRAGRGLCRACVDDGLEDLDAARRASAVGPP